MRNPNVALTVEQARTVARWSEPLFRIAGDGNVYRVEYVKRDGTESVSTGTIDALLKGQDSTLAITVQDASKPYAPTINVYGIIGIFNV